MVNSRFLVYLILFFIFTHQALAYELPGHERLANHAIDTFSDYFHFNITPEQRALIIKGDLDEDDEVRFLNHFYDPVLNRGLDLGVQKYKHSKDWTHDDINYGWEKALAAWRAGDRKLAFENLGHVLHLIQDLTVPEHTRNDPHPEGSPYEEFANTASLKLRFSEPPILNSVDEYFDTVANFTNHNFFTNDTIKSAIYYEPKVDKEVEIDGITYGIKNIEEQEVKLVLIKRGSISNQEIKTINNNLVLSSYYDILGNKAVTYGAGLIAFFFESVGQNMKIRPALLGHPKTFSSQILVGEPEAPTIKTVSVPDPKLLANIKTTLFNLNHQLELEINPLVVSSSNPLNLFQGYFSPNNPTPFAWPSGMPIALGGAGNSDIPPGDPESLVSIYNNSGYFIIEASKGGQAVYYYYFYQPGDDFNNHSG
jgi:hypothetical protein